MCALTNVDISCDITVTQPYTVIATLKQDTLVVEEVTLNNLYQDEIPLISLLHFYLAVNGVIPSSVVFKSNNEDVTLPKIHDFYQASEVYDTVEIEVAGITKILTILIVE